MAKYQGEMQKRERINRETLHPVWYGIGCVMSIITPIISGAAAKVLVDYGISQKFPYVLALGGTVQFPNIFYQIPAINSAAYYLSSVPFLEALTVFFVLFLLLFSGIFSMLNAILYRMFGPPKYSDIDSPPLKGNNKKKSR